MRAGTSGWRECATYAMAGLFMLAATVTFAQPATSAGLRSDISPEVDAIKTLERQIEAALQRADTAFLKSTLGDDLRFSHAGGTVAGKAETLTNFTKPGNFVSRTLTSVEVEVHGAVALTNGRIEVRSAAPQMAGIRKGNKPD